MEGNGLGDALSICDLYICSLYNLYTSIIMAYNQPGYIPRRKRPLGITLVAVLQLLGSLIMILAGITIVFGSALVEIDYGMTYGVFLFLFGLIGLFVAIALFSGKSWAWYLILIFTLLSLISDIMSIVIGGPVSIISLVIHLVILYYLFRPNVKRFFGI